MGRKKTFIDRTRAQTYVVVHDASGGAGRVLRPVGGGEDVGAEVVSGLERKAFELGEFGFPDDGYDYAKHFRAIGGGGGVYVGALGEEADADGEGADGAAVAGRGRGAVALKDEVFEAVGDAEEPGAVLLAPQDKRLRDQAIEEIRRVRKRNKDLHDVFALLDSDGELDSDEQDEARPARSAEFAEPVASDTDDGALDDNFLALADVDTRSDGEACADKAPPPARPRRLLDDRFDQLLRGYGSETDEDDEESDGDARLGALENENDAADFRAHLTTDELSALLAQGDLADDLGELHVEDGRAEGSEELLSASVAGESRVSAVAEERAREHDTIVGAEFERGLEGVLDSYKRVPAIDALEAIDGVEVALRAIAGFEAAERERLEAKAGIPEDEESDGHDSDLDSKFEEEARKDERWDCETILSTYTNLDNHPSVIDAPANLKRRVPRREPAIRLDPRTQAPIDYMPETGRDKAGADFVDYGSRRANPANVGARDKSETIEVKRARKAAAKEAARERRALKSEMKKAFASESAKQSRHAVAIGSSKVAVQF